MNTIQPPKVTDDENMTQPQYARSVHFQDRVLGGHSNSRCTVYVMFL